MMPARYPYFALSDISLLSKDITFGRRCQCRILPRDCPFWMFPDLARFIWLTEQINIQSYIQPFLLFTSPPREDTTGVLSNRDHDVWSPNVAASQLRRYPTRLVMLCLWGIGR